MLFFSQYNLLMFFGSNFGKSDFSFLFLKQKQKKKITGSSESRRFVADSSGRKARPLRPPDRLLRAGVQEYRAIHQLQARREKT